MVWESIVFMYGVSLGAFQIISSWAHLPGMSFFSKKRLGYIFGAFVIIAAFYWFFKTIEFSEGGPKGQHDDQFLSFALGILGAFLVTQITASILNIGRFKRHRRARDLGVGIEVFREETFFSLMGLRLQAIFGRREDAS